MTKFDAIWKIITSKNFMLIHSIREREVKGVNHKVCKVLRHTSYDEEGDKDVMKAAYFKAFKEVE